MVKAIKESFHLNGDKEAAAAVRKVAAWASLILVLGGIANWAISGATWKADHRHGIDANATKIMEVKGDMNGMKEDLSDIKVNVGILLERTAP